MDSTIHKLLPGYRRARAAGRPLVLATIVGTRGSTYRKTGAQMLFAPDGGSVGMLSGGCLEADMEERASQVFAHGVPQLVRYDSSSERDALWGLDSGCPGAMDVWLCLVGAATAWEPFASVEAAVAERRRVRYGLILESGAAGLPAGSVVMPFLGAAEGPSTFVAVVDPPPGLLVCGAGDDVVPLAAYAEMLGWSITVADPRPAFLEPGRFAPSARLACGGIAALGDAVGPEQFDAAIVMNHRLSADLAALERLAHSAIPFVGMLGPPARRNVVLERLGASAALLQGRLRAPVGLNLGGRDEADVALSIAAELQAFFAARKASRA
ncbi:MAG: XdhC family protein [Rhodocyclaceae bacterium]|nr:XdhC family protein [Rhodocyclaceae bacterium]